MTLLPSMLSPSFEAPPATVPSAFGSPGARGEEAEAEVVAADPSCGVGAPGGPGAEGLYSSCVAVMNSCNW